MSVGMGDECAKGKFHQRIVEPRGHLFELFDRRAKIENYDRLACFRSPQGEARIGRHPESDASKRIGGIHQLTLAYLAALSTLESGDDVRHRRKSASFNPGACPGLEVFKLGGREELTEICGQQCLRFEASSSIRLAPDETGELVQFVGHLIGDLLGDINGLFQIGDVGYRPTIECGTKVNMKLARCGSVAFLEDFFRCLDL